MTKRVISAVPCHQAHSSASSLCCTTNLSSFIYAREILFQGVKHKGENYLYYLSTTFLFSSAWRAFCPTTCISHSFQTCAYISLSKTGLFFLYERAFFHYHHFLFLYFHLFLFMQVFPTWHRHISYLWYLLHLEISFKKPSVCIFRFMMVLLY